MGSGASLTLCIATASTTFGLVFIAAMDTSSLSFSQNLILLKGKFGLFHNKVDLVLAPGMD